MNNLKLSSHEIAKIIERLVCSTTSMESECGKKKNIELAKEIFHKCEENGITIYAYDEEQYLGKIYKIKPNDDKLWSLCHEWTTEDPHYENPIYSEYDQLYMKDQRNYNEYKLEMLKNMRASIEDRCLIIIVKQTFGEKTYSYHFIYGNGFKIEGPFDENGHKVESDRNRIFFDPIRDVFNIFSNDIDGMLLNDDVINQIYATAHKEITKLEPIVEERKRRDFQERINNIRISELKDITFV